jgi:hypothetical protein
MAILDLGKIKLYWKGAWTTGTNYEQDDIVYHNGNVYICSQTHTASTNGEGLNRLAPGEKLRTSAYGAQYDAEKESVVYFVTKQTGKFYLNGRLTPNIRLDKAQRYRFYVYDTSMSGVNFRFSTSLDGTTYSTGVVTEGTPGLPGAYVEITVPLDAPALLYYKQDGTSGVANSATVTVNNIWQGFDYWEKVTQGMKWAGIWSNATQYYRNDIVSWDGSLYYAMADNQNEIPNIIQASRSAFTDWTGKQTDLRNNFVWFPLSTTSRARRKDLAMWLPNQGPINWPYLHNDDNNSAAYRKSYYISNAGRVYATGGGTSENRGLVNTGTGTSYMTELVFKWYDWHRSRDSVNADGFKLPRFEEGQDIADGHGKLYNRSGLPPKCIQIESNYDATYFLFDNGELWQIGYNGHGQAGYGRTGNNSRPVRVQNLHDRKIIKVSISKGFETSAHHAIALDDEGAVWVWGYNAYGQCGNGTTENVYSPRQLPQEYFGNEKIIDILATGQEYGSCYVRTESNFFYSWGYNGVGQLAVGDTTNRYTPVKITSFSPTANGGVLKFSMSGTSSGSFHILDGNGYMWHAGYNGYGTALNATTTNNTTLVRSTLAPTAGATVNFWAACPGGYHNVFLRTSNGNTYFVGYNGTNHNGLGNTTSPISSPTQVPLVFFPKTIASRATYTNNIRTTMLTDKGEVWYAGYDNYNTNGNEYYGGAASTIENGVNSYAVRMAIPASAKIIDMYSLVCDETTNYANGVNFFITDNGQYFGNGFAGRASQGNNYLLGGQAASFNAWIRYPTNISSGWAC